MWVFVSKSITIETYANFLSQIFKIQITKSNFSDRNPSFTSSPFKKFLKNNKQLLTTAHRAQTNGKVECLKQTIVIQLRCKVNEPSKIFSWLKLLK